MRGGFSHWFFGRELSRCAQIFTNAQYSHALQLPALLISQDLAFNLEASVGAPCTASPNSRRCSAKVPAASNPCTRSRSKEAGRWQKDRALSNIQLPGFTLPHKGETHRQSSQVRRGLCRNRPQPPGRLATTPSERFRNQTPPVLGLSHL